ncbi:hypothetical protein BDV12DRAFT_180387 [Aspergillus spectabilis]
MVKRRALYGAALRNRKRARLAGQAAVPPPPSSDAEIASSAVDEVETPAISDGVSGLPLSPPEASAPSGVHVEDETDLRASASAPLSPSSPSLPPMPCTRCAKAIFEMQGEVVVGPQPCVRPAWGRACLRCEKVKGPCLGLPVPAWGPVRDLMQLGASDAALASQKNFSLALDLAIRRRDKMGETNALLRSLNRNVFRLLQQQRTANGLPMLPESEEEDMELFWGAAPPLSEG